MKKVFMSIAIVAMIAAVASCKCNNEAPAEEPAAAEEVCKEAAPSVAENAEAAAENVANAAIDAAENAAIEAINK